MILTKINESGDFGLHGALVEQTAFKKRAGGAVYFYQGDGVSLDCRLESFIAEARQRFGARAEFNVIKLRMDEQKLSFLAYPSFLVEAHPALQRAITLDLATGVAKRADYTNNLNPPILHRKEQMVPPSYPRQAEFLALTEAEEVEGLYADTKTIGFRLNWERLLSKKGLSVEGHTLSRIEGDWVEPGEKSPEVLLVERHRTALRRYDLPSRWSARCNMDY